MAGLKQTTKETLSDQYKRLLVENERYLGLISKQEKKIARFDIKIKEVEDKVTEMKTQKGSYIDTLRRRGTQRKHIRILEERIHQATIRFDKLLSESKNIRNDIDHLRQQRATMTSVYQRLDSELQKQHCAMEDRMDKSVLAYDQTLEVLTRILAIHDRSRDSEMEDRRQMLEVNELRNISDHETKLHNFMQQKSQEKRPVFEEVEAKRKKADQDQHERIGGKSLEMYKAVHQRIVELTGESDLREIARTFVENEEKNFANFIYINELNNKGARLQDRISKLKKEIEQLELKNLQYEEKCKIHLKELEAELELKRLKANTLKAKSTLVCKVLARLKSAIFDLFTQVICDPMPIRNQSTGSDEVTDDNVSQYIGILEEWLSEVLMSQVQTMFKQAEEQHLQPHNPLLASFALLPTTVPGGTNRSVPTSFDDRTADAILGPGIEKPVDYQTLLGQVLFHMLKKEQGKAALVPTHAHKGKKKMDPRSA